MPVTKGTPTHHQEVNPSSAVAIKTEVKRIGVLLADLKDVNVPALKYLILQLNSLQRAFEFEFLPCDLEHKFIAMLAPNSQVERETTRGAVVQFLEDCRPYLQTHVTENGLKEPPPNYFVLVTLARFSDEYYTMRKKELSVIALGNWKRKMAPPSILEFLVTLLLREAVASVSKTLRGSIHLGTKGCLFDFTFNLEDARFKVLQGFVCNHCRTGLQADGYPDLARELAVVLSKEWLGKSNDPGSPAGIVSNFGFDLFLTKGLKPTAWESFLSTIQQEGVKEILKLIGAVILAGLIVWLGFKK
jgi:hypothetical protein